MSGGSHAVPLAPAPEALPHPVVDNHTHLDISRGEDADDPTADTSPSSERVGAAIREAVAAGVTRMVQIGCDLPGARWTVEAVDVHPELLGGVAIHPNEAPRLAEAGTLPAAYDEIAALATHPRVRVVGETGLDYFRTGPEGVAAQEESFRWHIRLAKELGKVLQVHDRDAHADVLRVLDEEGAPERTVMHCFSGDADLARECVRRGYHLSFAGTVTFKNADDLRAALLQTPDELLLVETDAPYLTPAPHRGRANAPAQVARTLRVAAEVRGTSLLELCQVVDRTSETVYGPWS